MALALSSSSLSLASASFSAGLLHCEMRKSLQDFGVADAYVLAAARKLKAKVLTGDLAFKNVKDAVLIYSCSP